MAELSWINFDLTIVSWEFCLFHLNQNFTSCLSTKLVKIVCPQLQHSLPSSKLPLDFKRFFYLVKLLFYIYILYLCYLFIYFTPGSYRPTRFFPGLIQHGRVLVIYDTCTVKRNIFWKHADQRCSKVECTGVYAVFFSNIDNDRHISILSVHGAQWRKDW